MNSTPASAPVGHRLGEDGAGHVGVAARLEHERAADGVGFRFRPGALLVHGPAARRREALDDQAQRGAAGVRVDGAVTANHGPSLVSDRKRDYKLAPMRLVPFAVVGASRSWRRCRVLANPRSVELRQAGFIHAYNLDHDKAVAAFKAAIEADPADPGAYSAMAAIAWLNLLYQRGSVSVDDYLGSMTQPNIKLKSPPADLAAQFHTNVEQALKLAEQRLRARPGDPEAHYEVGAAVGQMAAYMATVDGKVFGGFTAARRAFDEHERVLALDPSRKDAGLIIGTYRYIVANLNMVMRWMAYVAGFGGGRERAIEALESCGAYPSDVQAQAKLALVLIYNRERRYDAALRILHGLREQYPLNRLFWLEIGATRAAGRTRRPRRSPRSTPASRCSSATPGQRRTARAGSGTTSAGRPVWPPGRRRRPAPIWSAR